MNLYIFHKTNKQDLMLQHYNLSNHFLYECYSEVSVSERHRRRLHSRPIKNCMFLVKQQKYCAVNSCYIKQVH